MKINYFRDIIQHCHQRQKNPLRQQKTVAIPAMLSGAYSRQYTVYCAHMYPVVLDDLEQAEISFMPIGRAPHHDSGAQGLAYGPGRFLRRLGRQDWPRHRWDASWGIQIYTGIPSESNGARWHDLDFKYEAICAAPDAVLACIEALMNAVVNPLLTITKSGGLRFSCRVLDYLHPETEESRLYTYKYTPTAENPYHRDVYLEIFGDKGYSRWDARYEILCGSPLDSPLIPKEVLFAPLDALRVELHEPISDKIIQERSGTNLPLSLGSQNLDLAKWAFLTRGFTYLWKKNGFHHWTRHGSDVNNTDVSLWESEGTVWIRTSTPNAGLPTEAKPITEVWSDTDIAPPALTATPPVSEKTLAVRAGKLSPLAIKRPRPVLHKLKASENVHETPKKPFVQIESALDGTTRILGLIDKTGEKNNYQMESYIFNARATCLNATTPQLAEETEERLHQQNMSSVTRWKPRMYFWEQVKDIPVEVRMANPFQRGNVCEDPERCDALEEKGGNPSVSICPQCPVYTKCQQHGYLSQTTALQRAKTQIVESPHLFLNPQHTKMTKEILKEENRLCIINNLEATHNLFSIHIFSRNMLEGWIDNWYGSVLGNFTKALLNALEIKGESHSNVVNRVRIVIQAFEPHAEEIIQQMCQVNVRGKVIARGMVDAETGKELAHFSIEFEGRAIAYIPLNNSNADTLKAKGFPVFLLHDFLVDEDMRIPMPMAEAIQLGILDPATVENIQAFPTICSDLNWTFWHQLKCFFAHYTRDADAPIRWNHKVLWFWMPPVLHSSISRLVLISTTLSERHLQRAFPDDDFEVNRIEPTPWLPGNQVFQIRTGLYPRETILDYGNPWDLVKVSKIGHRFLAGIRAEIERTPNVKHLIVSDWLILQKLKKIIKTENVRFVAYPGKKIDVNTYSENAEVIWIVGMPERPIGTIWNRSQALFGNDEKPLCYDREIKPYHYKDKRVQSVYEEAVALTITEVFRLTQLDRQTGKKAMLLTGLELPGITDRPETLLFDWEDYEIAGGLDKLADTIATRQRFETEREHLTPESNRKEVERILGCSPRQANRFLKTLRGGNIPHVPFREQILSLLEDSEKKTAELIETIDGHPEAIKHELTRLVKADDIVRVRRGVYALPKT